MNEVILISAFIIDFIFGDPPLIFIHPIVFIGRVIEYFEPFFIKFKNKNLGGLFFVIFIVFIIFLLVTILLNIIHLFNNYLAFLFTVILGSFTLSLRSLHLETKKVFTELSAGNIEKARKKLSFLVSRDTNELEEKDIIRSVVETIGENITDGIIAPLFYFAIGGIKLAFVYKTINTLDSMIGYKNDKYINFGYFAAKIDDLFNFIPARITGALIVVSSFILQYNWKNSYKILIRDRRNSDSPNSGWSESALAGALNIRLGGPTPYFGVWHDKSFIGDEIEPLNLGHILKSYKIMYVATFVFILIYLTIMKFLTIN